MSSSQHDIEQRVRLAGNNMFELLLFRLGEAPGSEQRELYGINVFKVREILAMPEITVVAGANPEILGVADIRGQIIPVIDLAQVTGCRPKNGPKILLVTEFARTTQGFAVEEVDDIVRLEWNQVLSAESHSSGRTVTSFARLDGNVDGSRLAQVLDVEQILRDVLPSTTADEINESSTGRLVLKPGTKVLAADDSGVARSLIEQSLNAMGVSFIMTKSGQEAWNVLEDLQRKAESEGRLASDEIALVLTDLEMPEMDGFTLTRRIKANAGMQAIPVVIHSSLSGSANEEHVRKVGANAYVSKFAPAELATVMRNALKTGT
ncbi:MAG: chemotaxis protein [Pseudomonadota bacterium]|uniref:Chemotaxis protein CheV n=1 Tax=Caballeronia sordidicola TaxID=196367 RepID=A0A242N4M9_CABSO|nr:MULTISPECIES: chemotaxis protein [Burkholderiaceae]AME26435.1 chemotaxis protein CheV [Burkholderia sp. PAMC 26561]AMM17287.1 chemotaxis protein CheV [Burkholderia sp. PAMC 28687]MDP9157891.1 chemotaxis protein [Pseudomonadota bacterium]OTP78628.1 Chemotaxis protein CheV [Caballeronia sordidicola]